MTNLNIATKVSWGLKFTSSPNFSAKALGAFAQLLPPWMILGLACVLPAARTVVLLGRWVIWVPLCKSVGTGCQQVGVVTPWERQTRICRRHQSSVMNYHYSYMQGRIRPHISFLHYSKTGSSREGYNRSRSRLENKIGLFFPNPPIPLCGSMPQCIIGSTVGHMAMRLATRSL